MLQAGGLAGSDIDARRRLCAARDNGDAAERLQRMVGLLGGPDDLLDRPARILPYAPHRVPVLAGQAGAVAAIDARALGIALVALGGGRRRPGEGIDVRVGIDGIAAVGTSVDADTPLAVIHGADSAACAALQQHVRQAFRLAEQARATPLLLERIAMPEAAETLEASG